MQKNIDSETLRFSELVHSYIMFINEMMMAITIIAFFILFQFSNNFDLNVYIFINFYYFIFSA